jgi:hypothetical protein
MYSLTANSSLLTITLDSSTLVADQVYGFEMSVKGKLDSNPVAFLSFDRRVKTNATETIDTLTLDNLDYYDTTTYNPVDTSGHTRLTNQVPYESRFTQLDVGYAGGGVSDKAQLEYLTYGLTGSSLAALESGALNHSQNSVYLVSRVQLMGTLQIRALNEEFANAGEVDSESYSQADMYYKLDMAAQDVNNELNQLTDISGRKVYLLDKPSNYGVSGNGLDAVYGEELASGANIAAKGEGLYYLYALPLPAPINGGFYESIELSVDLVANGAAIKGTKVFTVH